MVPSVRALLVSLFLIASALALVPPSRAAVLPSGTIALVNPGQVVHDSSSAVPVFGFSASGSPGDALVQIEVDFSGLNFDAGDNADLLGLGAGGLAVFRDTGTADDALDAADFSVQTFGVNWNGMMATVDVSESVPPGFIGQFHWIIAIRTGDDPQFLWDGDEIIATVPQNGIRFSDGTMQPSVAISAAPLTVRVTAVTDTVAAFPWIGPMGTTGSARAVAGIRIADGGIATNRGIADRFDQIVVRVQDNGGLDADDLLPFSTNPGSSGVGLYRDSNDNDAWDASDAGITLLSTPTTGGACTGGTGIPICLDANDAVPDASGGSVDLWIVVRAGTLESGDSFGFFVLPDDIRIDGAHATDLDRLVLQDGSSNSPSFLFADISPPCISSSCGVSNGPLWQDPANSPYLAINPSQSAFFFSSLMPSAVTARLHYHALDNESGLGTATFSGEPSLASSPASQSYGGVLTEVSISADYMVNADSTDESAPMWGTITDSVGNTAWYGLEYYEDNVAPAIVADPGWRAFVSPLWANASGTMWFSDWITGVDPADIRVDLYDEIAGVRNASATAESSLGGSPFYRDPLSFSVATGQYLDWEVQYGFASASTAASSPVDLWVCDHVANCASRSFAYAEDNSPPVVTISWPTWGETLSGWSVPTATVTDAHTATGIPLIRVEGQLADTGMFWDGSEWTYGLQTALYADGPQRIVVRVDDAVGNTGASLVDINFLNSAPTMQMLSPTAGALVRGTVAVTAVESNGSPVTAAEVQIDSASWVPMAPDPVTGGFSYSWDTAGLSGPHIVRVRGYTGTTAGGIASATVTVDNDAPALAFISPIDAAEVSGALTVQLTATDALGVDSVRLRFDTGGWIPLVYDSWSGAHTLVWDTLAFADGAHTLSAEAFDLAGNSNIVVTVSVLVDNTAPSLFVNSPGVAVPIFGAVPVDITADDASGSGFDATGGVRYRVDSGLWITLAGGPPTWTASLDTLLLADGSHTVSFESFDDAWNAASTALAVSVDNTAPFAAIVSPLPSEFVFGVLTVDVQSSDAVGLASLAVTVTDLDTAAIVLTRAFTPGTGDRYTVAVGTGAWSDGDYSVVATATDRTGRAVTDTVAFRLDNDAPALAVTVPVGGGILEGSVLLQATATDRFLDTTDYSVDGASWTAISAAFDTTAVIDGAHTIEVRARDLAGHVTTQSIQVLVDNAPPQVALLLPLPGEVLHDTVRVEAVAVDANGIASVTLTAAATVDMILDVALGRYVALLDTAVLADGAVTLVVQASDVAGHTATASRTATVDNSVPTIALGTVQVWPGRGKITATVDDPSGVAVVEVNIDGAAWQVMAKDSSGSYTNTFHTEVGDNGGHSFEVRATDAVGNAATASGSFLVDNPADVWGGFLDMIPFLALVFSVLFLLLLMRWIRRGKIQRWWEEGVAETRAFLEADEARFQEPEAKKPKVTKPVTPQEEIEIPEPPKEPSEFRR